MKIILVLFILIPLNAKAVNFSVLGQKGEVLWSSTKSFRLPKSAGSVTLEFLKKGLAERGISAFSANENEVLSVNALGSDIKVISEDELEYYQWCFSINGFLPGSTPKETVIIDQNTNISWYYAFSLLRQGEWVSECIPAHQSKFKN